MKKNGTSNGTEKDQAFRVRMQKRYLELIDKQRQMEEAVCRAKEFEAEMHLLQAQLNASLTSYKHAHHASPDEGVDVWGTGPLIKPAKECQMHPAGGKQ